MGIDLSQEYELDILDAVKSERERIIQLLLRVKAMTTSDGFRIERGFSETALRALLDPSDDIDLNMRRGRM